jgi:hypothetical protein
MERIGEALSLPDTVWFGEKRHFVMAITYASCKAR